MKPLRKVALVAIGYVVCLAIAFAVVALHIGFTSGPDRQSAGGMYGFGDSILFVAAFGVPALVPTGAALFFLKPYGTFWKVLSAAGVALAAADVMAAILFAITRGGAHPRLATVGEYSLLSIIASPLLALAFLVGAVFSPLRTPRIVFIAAAAMEFAVTLFAGVTLYLHMP